MTEVDLEGFSFPKRGESTARDCLPVLERLLEHPSLRKDAFAIVEQRVGVSHSALKQARKRSGYTEAKRTKFSAQTEALIVAYLITQSVCKKPASTEQIKQFIFEFTKQTVSTWYITNLVKKHKTLLSRGRPGIEPTKRHAPQIVEDTDLFIESFSSLQAHLPISKANLMNTDEKRGGYSSTSGLRLMTRGEFNANLEGPQLFPNQRGIQGRALFVTIK